MIGVAEEKVEIESSSKPRRVHRLLELQIGRILRFELDDRSWGVSVTSGKLLGVSLSGDDIELKIRGFDRIEYDPEEYSAQISVFQKDTGKWKKIYRSKGWEKGLGL